MAYSAFDFVLELDPIENCYNSKILTGFVNDMIKLKLRPYKHLLFVSKCKYK